MKTKMKVLALGLVFCLGMAVSAPITHAAGATSAKVAATTKPMAKTTHRHHRMAKANAQVKKAQETLIKDGAKIKADGIMGKHTCLAIKNFQKKNSLKVTGKLDKETLAKLQ